MVDLKINQKKDTVKTIEINDNGDIITLDLGDNNFLKKLYNFENSVKNFKNAGESDLHFNGALRVLYEGIENLFGEGAVFKIFAREEPSFLLVHDFMQQIMNFVSDQISAHFGKNLNRAQNRETRRQ